MAFRMPRPSQRPDSKNAQLSLRIPTDLLTTAPGTVVKVTLSPDSAGAPPLMVVARCGKTHLRASLGTSNTQLAKERQAQALTAVSNHWRTLRGEVAPKAPPAELSPRQCAVLAGDVYRHWQDSMEQDPVFPAQAWQRIAEEFEAIEAGKGPRASALIPSPKSEAYQEAILEDMDDRAGAHVGAVLSAAGLVINNSSRNLLTKRVFEALRFSAQQSARLASGDFRPDPEAGRFPASDKPLFKPPAKSFEKVFEEYAVVPGKFGPRTERTLATYRAIFTRDFAGFIKRHCKHSDPLRVCRQDVSQWRNELLSQGLSQKTIADGRLAAVSTIYTRQVEDGYILSNPANAGMKKQSDANAGSEREHGLTSIEAASILSAARSFEPGRHGAILTTAIRWVPLIAAATGARITEICQARLEDFQQDCEGWTLRITPEAGGVKNKRFRVVPLHSGLMALGLEDFLGKAIGGPLFYNPPTPGKVSLASARGTGGRLAEWVRNDVGITDERVAPNHGWRHRFSTLCRRFGVHSEYRKAIGGWAKSDQSEHYGDMAGLRREIERIKASDMFPGCGFEEAPRAPDKAEEEA